MLAGMRAPRAVFRRDLRAFEMYIGDHVHRSGSASRAAAMIRRLRRIFSSEAVMKVGRNVVTPVASMRPARLRTVSTVRSSALRLSP